MMLIVRAFLLCCLAVDGRTMSVEANGVTATLVYEREWSNITSVVRDFVREHAITQGAGCAGEEDCVSRLIAAIPKKTVVVYAYSEHSPDALTNLRYFLRFGVFDGDVDFVFVLNGCHSISAFPHYATVIERDNSCFDFGAWSVGIRHLRERGLSYENVVLINASVRGPFLPRYVTSRWPDLFTDQLNGDVALVGTTVNCMQPGDGLEHLQSMFLALRWADLDGWASGFLRDGCAATKGDAIYNGELPLSRAALTAGKIKSQLLAFQAAEDGDSPLRDTCDAIRDRSLLGLGDVYFPRPGLPPDVSPLEVVFFKTARSRVHRGELERLTDWAYFGAFGGGEDGERRRRTDFLASGDGCEATPRQQAGGFFYEEEVGDGGLVVEELQGALRDANLRVGSLTAQLRKLQDSALFI